MINVGVKVQDQIGDFRVNSLILDFELANMKWSVSVDLSFSICEMEIFIQSYYVTFTQRPRKCGARGDRATLFLQFWGAELFGADLRDFCVIEL